MVGNGGIEGDGIGVGMGVSVVEGDGGGESHWRETTSNMNCSPLSVASVSCEPFADTTCTAPALLGTS